MYFIYYYYSLGSGDACSFSKILSANEDEIRSLIINGEKSVLTRQLKQLTPDEVRRKMKTIV